LREWGGSPSGITNTQIENFIKKVEQGLIEEYSGNIKAEKLNQILEKIYTTIEYKNKML
jgi:hypothetical protein